MLDLRAIERVLEQHRERLMAVPGVLGTAIGFRDGKLCVRVFVSSAFRDRDALPKQLGEFPVMIDSSDTFIATDSD